ncbi:MAG: hypothetical protein ACHQ53_14410 [Polyangiales bacterium]
MRDLADIDRTLGELGQPTDDVKGLLERALGANRSLDRLDAMLGELAPGMAPPTPARPVVSGRHARWSRPAAARGVERSRRASEPVRDAAAAATAESEPAGKEKSSRATLVGIPSRPPVPVAADEPVRDEPELSLQPEDTDPEIELSAQDAPDAAETDTDTGSWQRPEQSASAAQILGFDAPEQSGSADADAVTRISTPPEAEESTTTRFDARALLDRQLDPEDFANEGAAQEPEAAAAEASDESDDFELLIDDDEILEIEELDEE